MCVRTCDGYYFPISSATDRGRFYRDAEACRSRCGGKLFYLPKHSSDIAGMRDLSGRRYEDFEKAFVYRERLIDGCTCRPMPWSASERARHRRYAYEAEIARLNRERTQMLVAQAREQKRAEEQHQGATDIVLPLPKSRALAAVENPNPAQASPFSDQLVEADARPGSAAPYPRIDEGKGRDAPGDAAAPVTNLASSQVQKVPRRIRKSRQKQALNTIWPFAGSGSGSGSASSYSWPGDR